MMGNLFKDSVQKERFIKSIKLELVPHQYTKKALEEHGTKNLDDMLIESSEAVKPAVTYAAKQIISKALENANISFSKLYEIFQSLENGSADYTPLDYTKEYEKVKKSVEKVLSSYKLNGKLRSSDLGTSAFISSVPDLIPDSDLLTEEKDKCLIAVNNTKGLATMLEKFSTTRTTAVNIWASERVLENFEIYARNISSIQAFLSSPFSDEFVKDFPELVSMASAEYYEVSCMTPDGIKGYNQIISGEIDAEGIVKKGYNGFANELNMRLRTDSSYEGPFFRKIKPLHQQVLFPKEKLFTYESLESDDDVRVCLKDTFQKASKKTIFDLITLLKSAGAGDIVIKGNDVHTLSHLVTGKHDTLPNLLIQKESHNLDKKLKELENLSKAVSKEEKKGLAKEKKKLKDFKNNISKYIAGNEYTFKDLEQISREEILKKYIEEITNIYNLISESMQKISESDIFEDGNLRGYHKDKMLIHDYVNLLTQLSRTISLILCDSEKGNVLFYNKLTENVQFMETTKLAVKLITSYMTRKTSDMAKEYPVCFGVPSRFSAIWWNESIDDDLKCKFTSKIQTIIKMDEKYYFCVLGAGQKPFEFEYSHDTEEYYEVFNQKTAQDASKIFPRMLFNIGVGDFFEKNPNEKTCTVSYGNKTIEVSSMAYKIYKDKLFSVEAKKNKVISEKQFEHNLAVMIDLYKQFAACFPHYRRFSFDFKETGEYKDLGEFMADANASMVSPRWEHIRKDQIDELIRTGRLYAFLITNRNMYKNDNVKTSYAETFLELMSYRNFETGQMRINSKPQITFRPQCIPLRITHPKGSMLVNKKDNNGNFIPTHVYKELYNHLNENLAKNELSAEAVRLLDNELVGYHRADHDIARDMRYMQDKYFISISYVQNAKVSARNYNDITRRTEEYVQGEYRTLSVARGTKDLIYYMLFDKDYTLMEQNSLNQIGDVDFYKKLTALSRERNEGKADTWNYSITVKEYKEWYLNAAIGRLIDIAVENEAVIVIEDINNSIKDKYSCIDNQVFKSFERKLEDRLMDYRKKHTSEGIGSLINPLQLAGSMSYGQQNGILYKLNGAYTANVCEDGFINLFDTRSISSQTQKLEFVKRFKSVYYDESTKTFSVTFNFDDFKTTKEPWKKEWTLIIGKPQTKYNREKGHNEFIPYPAEPVVSLLYENNHLDGNIVDHDLSKKEAAELYDQFIAALKNRVVKECKENAIEYVTSLTTYADTKESACQIKCKTLAKKLWYTIQAKEENVKDYTSGWFKALAE